MLARWMLILALVTQSLTARPMACPSANDESTSRAAETTTGHSCCCGDGCSMQLSTSDASSQSAFCGCGDESGPVKTVPAIPAGDRDPSPFAAVLVAASSLPAHAACEAVARPAIAAVPTFGGGARLAIHCIWML